MIYAIRALGTCYIKIGYTKDESAQARLDALQTGCPHELKVIAFGPGDMNLEAKIHWRLKRANSRHRGEWFLDTPETQKVVWEIRESAEVAENLVWANVQPAPSTKTPGRLGRVLEYAKRFTDDTPAEAPSVSRVA